MAHYLIQLFDVMFTSFEAVVWHPSPIWGYIVRKETHPVLRDEDDDNGDFLKNLKSSYLQCW